jgi:hypothetical protein
MPFTATIRTTRYLVTLLLSFYNQFKCIPGLKIERIIEVR